MSSRITKASVYFQVNLYNAIAKERGWETYDLHVWNPGDNGPRYQLTSAKNGADRSLVCNTREMYNVLFALLNVIERN